jgi:hypothetical protein
VNDPLSRLRAGLDRDEQLARAAASRAAEWKEMDDAVVGGPFYPAEPEYLITESGTHTIVYPEGWPSTAEAQHIARHDPATTLHRVEVIRELFALRDGARDLNEWNAYEMALIHLASIYTTDETEGAQP